MKHATEVQPLDRAELRTSYNVQGMLLNEHNFPDEVCDDDFTYSFYTDRLGKLGTAFWDLNRETFGCPIDNWAVSECGSNILNWARKVFQLINPNDEQTITGCRIVRYSDAGGYAVHRIDYVGVKPENEKKVRYLPRRRPERAVFLGDGLWNTLSGDMREYAIKAGFL